MTQSGRSRPRGGGSARPVPRQRPSEPRRPVQRRPFRGDPACPGRSRAATRTPVPRFRGARGSLAGAGHAHRPGPARESDEAAAGAAAGAEAGAGGAAHNAPRAAAGAGRGGGGGGRSRPGRPRRLPRGARAGGVGGGGRSVPTALPPRGGGAARRLPARTATSRRRGAPGSVPCGRPRPRGPRCPHQPRFQGAVGSDGGGGAHAVRGAEGGLFRGVAGGGLGRAGAGVAGPERVRLGPWSPGTSWFPRKLREALRPPGLRAAPRAAPPVGKGARAVRVRGRRPDGCGRSPRTAGCPRHVPPVTSPLATASGGFRPPAPVVACGPARAQRRGRDAHPGRRRARPESVLQTSEAQEGPEGRR